MSVTETIKISDAEWEIMRVVWNKETVDATTIEALLGEAMGWKLATVKTLLGRLVKKNILTTTQVGKKFIYTARVTEDETIRSEAENLLTRICATKAGQTIAEMLEIAELTAEDLLKIQQILATKQPTQAIVCNCLPGQCHCQEELK